MSISASSSADGSSSTTMAMFCIALRKRRGTEASASATSFSNAFRFTRGLLCGFRGWRGLAPAGQRRRRARLFRGFAVAGAGDDQPEIIAVVAHHALVAQRLRPADAASVEDERVRGSRPAIGRHGGGELL